MTHTVSLTRKYSTNKQQVNKGFYKLHSKRYNAIQEDGLGEGIATEEADIAELESGDEDD